MAIIELWTEKYRPSTLDGYVFMNDNQKAQIKGWIEQKTLPHCLFSGSPGTGKTTLAKLLFNELAINELDILEINASRTNSVDDVRNKITNFVQMIPFGEFKVVLCDEFDFMSTNGQAALRGLLEEYSSSARFVFTANYPNKIIPAIHSRCQGFHIDKLDQTEFTTRAAEILLNESIEFDLDTLDTFVKATYPDLRKCINNMQMNSSTGSLVLPKADTGNSSDYRLEMVELFKKGKFREARLLICGRARSEEMEDIYRWLYDNITLFGDEVQQDAAIVIIKQGLVDHTLVSDTEINLAAVMVRLSAI